MLVCVCAWQKKGGEEDTFPLTQSKTKKDYKIFGWEFVVCIAALKAVSYLPSIFHKLIAMQSADFFFLRYHREIAIGLTLDG